MGGLVRHTCINDDGGTPNRRCEACESERKTEIRGLQRGVPEERTVMPMQPNPFERETLPDGKVPGQLMERAEVRVTDAVTGGQKGSKLARFSLIPRDFLWELAEHYGRGARKYEDRNWQKGYKWSLTVDALDRHLSAWLHGTPENNWQPEDNDPETGSSHLIAVAWHVIALWWFHKHGRGTDDIRGVR